MTPFISRYVPWAARLVFTPTPESHGVRLWNEWWVLAKRFFRSPGQKLLVWGFTGGAFFLALPALALTVEPPTKYTTFMQVAGAVIRFLRAVFLPIAIIMILYAAFLYMTAGGNEQKVGRAHSALIWGLVGLAVVLIGEGFITVVCNALRNPKGC